MPNRFSTSMTCCSSSVPFLRAGRLLDKQRGYYARSSLASGTFQSTPSDMSVFDQEEFSGVAGTELRNTWTYELARWLVHRYPSDIKVEWNPDEQARRMAVILPNIVPLLEDDSFVEPDTPFLEMMALAAGGEDRPLPWLLDRFNQLPVTLLQKTGLYDSLEVQLVWKLGKSPVSRTLARRPVQEIFVHRTPLLQRRDVSLRDELKSEALPLRKLKQHEGQEVLDFAREALAIRYRELHGTTNGEGRHVYEATVGRGVTMYLWGSRSRVATALACLLCGNNI